MVTLVLAVGLGSACAYKVVHGGRLSRSAIDRLLSDVERIRGLKATAPLRVSMEGRRRPCKRMPWL